MKRNLFVYRLIALWSSASLFLYFFFCANIDPYLLSWTNSVKDGIQPAPCNRRIRSSVFSNLLSNSYVEKTIETTKETQSINRSSTQGTFSLKRYSDDFQTNWCRIHQARLDWSKYLAPCAGQTQWTIKDAGWKNIQMKTDAAKSFISKWDIRPVGEFSRFFIQSKTPNNHIKSIGGDSWRIRIKGTSSVSATVFDQNNGVYEVIFLLMEAGIYQIEIYLDYTLCDGFKDPPDDWYKKGNYQGKNQADGILKGDKPYLMESFQHGKSIRFQVLPPKYPKSVLGAMEKIREKIFEGNQNTCSASCHGLLSDGFGRWINGTWKTFSKDLQRAKNEPHDHEGVLWIYGDSVSKSFAEHLVTGPYRQICEDVFKHCKMTYSWVYNIDNVRKDSNLDGEDYDHEKVMREITKVLMDGKGLGERSVIMLNWGIHFAAAVSFTLYKKLISEFLETLQAKRWQKKFDDKIIWRTTTAIFRERFANPHKDVRRFLTFPRIILYNAYAMSAMCKAGVDVIDVYPMTDSFPPGTVSKQDPVHYERRAMESVQQMLYYKYRKLK